MSKHVTAFLASLGLLVAATAQGGDEPPVRGEGTTLPYLQAIHTKVHRLWTDSFLAMADSQLAKDHPINLPSRATGLEVVITAEGKLAGVKVAQPSGAADFDSSAVDVIKAAAPFAVPPEEVLSDDGKTHVLWTLARDDRRCSGVSVTVKTKPLEEAIAALVAQGREKVAVARMRAADDKDRQAAFTQFARAWLDRYEDDRELSLQVAEANALAGDPRGADRLRRAANSSDTETVEATEIARALATLKVPVCPLLRESFAAGFAPEAIAEHGASPTPSPDLSDKEFVKRLQIHQGRARILSLLSEGADGACLSFAISVAKDRSAKANHRALALWGLGRTDSPESKAAVRSLLQDHDPTVRAAAIFADTRQGVGKGAVFRLIPFLRDPSIAVRSAAAVGLVRAGGEDILPQLFQIWKERDDDFFAAVAAELADQSGQASADMLVRLLRKDNPRTRLAAARALAARHDDAAAKALADLAKTSDPELRFLAGAVLDPESRVAAASAPKGYTWTESFLALARGSGKLAAVDWALAQFPKIEPATRIYLMGTWLVATRPKN